MKRQISGLLIRRVSVRLPPEPLRFGDQRPPVKAITYHAPADLRVERVPDPVLLAPTDALVRVRLAAICGSDLHVWHGRETGVDPGSVMGHEFVGEVLEVGGKVSRIHPGDRVASPF